MHEVARRISDLRAQYAEKCAELRKLKPNLVEKITPASFNGTALAVDGGVAHFSFMSVDVVAVRSAAVLFQYDSSQVTKAEHYPARQVEPVVKHAFSLEPHESLIFKSLTRLRSELECAIKAVGKYRPSLVLLDGSIVPQLSDKPPKQSELYVKYEDVIAKFKQLYGQCEENHTTLAGVVKDPRGKRFCSIAGAQLDGASDAFLVSHLLAAGERTCEFSYAEFPESHNLLAALAPWSSQVHSFYLRPGADQPYRVDYLSRTCEASQLASQLSALSTPGAAYSYPPILIEADLRAAMSDQLVQRVFREVAFPGNVVELRRNSRPFR